MSVFRDKIPIFVAKFTHSMMEIAQNLKKIRVDRKLSQQEVADSLGIDRKTYVNWEAGVSDIKSSYLPELAKFFNVEISEFFRESKSEIIINQQNSDNKDNSINGIILLLTDKEAVNQLVEIMKERFVRNG